MILKTPGLLERMSIKATRWTGSSVAFALAVLIIVAWAVTGPIFKFSDTWQLVINTGTTIVTFLMVFLIQNTQNRDSKALHLKLDELLYAMKEARTGLVDLEDLSDAELAKLEKEFRHVARREAAAVVEDEIEEKVETERKVRRKKAAGARSS